MTRIDFARIMAYISAAVGKPLAEETAEVYFEELKDLQTNVLQVAAKRVVLSHKWSTFPNVAELREAAAETMLGNVTTMSAGEAWQIATKVCWNCDVDIPGDVERALAQIPAAVRTAIHRFGFKALYNPGDNLETMRAQFTRIYEQIVADERQRALLPAALQRQIESIDTKKNALPAQIEHGLARIGQIPA